MIGRVGTELGKVGVNIRHMDVGPSVRSLRHRHHYDPHSTPDTALMIISVDDALPDSVIEEITRAGDIFGATLVKL
jgi:D-3-phosphoglycerate dehydrogenase